MKRKEITDYWAECAIIVVTTVVFYALLSAWVTTPLIRYTGKVQVRLVPNNITEVAVGGKLDVTRPLDELELISPYVDVFTAPELSYVDMYLPANTYRFDLEWGAHLARTVHWKPYTALSKGGMLRLNEQYYALDTLEEQITREYALHDNPGDYRGVMVSFPVSSEMLTNGWGAVWCQVIFWLTMAGCQIWFAQAVLAFVLAMLAYLLLRVYRWLLAELKKNNQPAPKIR